MFCGESTMLNPLIKEKEAAVNQMGEYLHYLAICIKCTSETGPSKYSSRRVKWQEVALA